NREDTGASASARSLPKSQEKTTKTSATGESSVQPNKGETSSRVLAVGFHATVGPITKMFSGLPRVSLTVKFLYSISTPTFRRSLGNRMGVMTLWEKPHSRPRSPVFSFSKNQFMDHSKRSPKSWARSKRNSYASGTLGGPPMAEPLALVNFAKEERPWRQHVCLRCIGKAAAGKSRRRTIRAGHFLGRDNNLLLGSSLRMD